MLDECSLLLYLFKALYFFKVESAVNQSNSLLIYALRANAAFSSISAVLMIAAADWVTRQLGLTGPLPVHVTGSGLLLFSAQLWAIVRSERIRAWEIKGIIAGDLAWVAASVVLVALYHDVLTRLGLLLVDVVTLAVLAFAVLQILGLRRCGPGRLAVKSGRKAGVSRSVSDGY
jgi:hypothetical protein